MASPTSAASTSPSTSNSAPKPQPVRGEEGRARVLVEGVTPQIDGGRFPVKRVVGDRVTIGANVFVDGHDRLTAVVRYRHENDPEWSELPLRPLVNDEWEAELLLKSLGNYTFTVEAWVDHFTTWREDLKKRLAAGQDVAVDLLIGAELVADAARHASGVQKEQLQDWVRRLRAEEATSHVHEICHDAELGRLMEQNPFRDYSTTYERELGITVDRERARFSTWYEFFPRSVTDGSGEHGNFKTCLSRLPYVAEMGFDVIYLPPIHPVGDKFRKGKNNTTTAEAGDVGSPWAIGNKEGGHKAVHPDLGTLDDFRTFVKEARKYDIEIALDVALQCSPDHPYVADHPNWFKERPDGTIQYAENPPKKYQDIYPFDFESDDWEGMWSELKSIFEFWMDNGVSIFRVDNPHTKSFAFWEWCIAELKKKDPGVILLAEAFTRPKVMGRLAKLGYTQSYTYFTWRNTKEELTEYLTELTQTELAEYFRPNFWPNTPDILHEFLQTGGRPAFMLRAVLAATLTANYGMYGPAYELAYNVPVKPGSEEYIDSEKYQIVNYNLDDPKSLKEFIASINQVRREQTALQRNDTLAFHPVDNDHLICYSKRGVDPNEIIVMVVNLDPYHSQSGWLELPLDEFGFEPGLPYQAHDQLTDARFLWQGPRNYVELNPHECPAHIFRLRRRVRTERDFEYFL